MTQIYFSKKLINFFIHKLFDKYPKNSQTKFLKKNYKIAKRRRKDELDKLSIIQEKIK